MVRKACASPEGAWQWRGWSWTGGCVSAVPPPILLTGSFARGGEISARTDAVAR